MSRCVAITARGLRDCVGLQLLVDAAEPDPTRRSQMNADLDIFIN